MTACENCGATDVLFFTCSHCGEQFCADHQFPHHACAGFGRTDDGTGEVGESRSDASSADRDGPSTAATRATAATGTGAGTGTETTERGTDADRDGRAESSNRTASLTVESIARDAARAMRPDREGPAEEPPGRGMPWEREGTTVADWIRDQSYPGFVAKVGSLAFVFTLAYYAGLAAVLYGYV